MKWFAALLLLVVVFLGLIFSVGRSSTREADLIFISGDDLHFLDPQRSSWMVDFRILTCLYDTLILQNIADDTLEPGIAERWEISEDGLTYTFHLREAKWSNGDPVRSRDFVYGWRRALLPDFAADYTTMLYHIRGGEDFFNFRQQQLAEYAKLPESEKSVEKASALYEEALRKFDEIVGIETPDDRTLIVHLAHPTAYFLELVSFMTFSPVHEASIEKFVSLSAATGMLQQNADYFQPGNIVSNGPYVLKRRRPKRDLLLVANEHYWNRQAMQNNSVLMKVITDTLNAMTTYETGEADWYPDVKSVERMAAELKASGRRDLHVYPSCGTYFFIFNCSPTLPESGEKNPFADARVRRAFSMAIDREQIVKQVTMLDQPIAYTLTPPNVFPGYEPPVDAGVRFDPEEARRLLAEAGYPNGQGMPRLKLLYNSDGGHNAISQQLQRTWLEVLNVHVELDSRDAKIFGQERRAHKFAIARGNWFGDYRDPTTFLQLLHSRDGNNNGLYANPEYDALLEKAARENDPQKRFAILRDAERLLMQEQAVAPVFHYIDLELFDPQRVLNVNPNAMKNRRIDQIRVVRSEVEVAAR